MANKPNGKKPTLDTANAFRLADAEILQRVDIFAAYEKYCKARFTSRTPSHSGFLQLHALGRDDNNPSAGVRVKNGQYVDLAIGLRLPLYEAIAKFGGLPDWRAARAALAADCGVILPGSGRRSRTNLTGSVPFWVQIGTFADLMSDEDRQGLLDDAKSVLNDGPWITENDLDEYEPELSRGHLVKLRLDQVLTLDELELHPEYAIEPTGYVTHDNREHIASDLEWHEDGFVRICVPRLEVYFDASILPRHWRSRRFGTIDDAVRYYTNGSWSDFRAYTFGKPRMLLDGTSDDLTAAERNAVLDWICDGTNFFGPEDHPSEVEKPEKGRLFYIQEPLINRKVAPFPPLGGKYGTAETRDREKLDKAFPQCRHKMPVTLIDRHAPPLAEYSPATIKIPKSFMETLHNCGRCEPCRQLAVLRWYRSLVVGHTCRSASGEDVEIPAAILVRDARKEKDFDFYPEDQQYFGAAVPARNVDAVLKQIRKADENYVAIAVDGKETTLVVATGLFTFSHRPGKRADTGAIAVNTLGAASWVTCELRELFHAKPEKVPGQNYRPVSTSEAWGRRSDERKFRLIARPGKDATSAMEFGDVLADHCKATDIKVDDDRRMRCEVKLEPSAGLLRTHGRRPVDDISREREIRKLLESFRVEWHGLVMELIPIESEVSQEGVR
jgi:hypothetical protein